MNHNSKAENINLFKGLLELMPKDFFSSQMADRKKLMVALLEARKAFPQDWEEIYAMLVWMRIGMADEVNEAWFNGDDDYTVLNMSFAGATNLRVVLECFYVVRIMNEASRQNDWWLDEFECKFSKNELRDIIILEGQP